MLLEIKTNERRTGEAEFLSGTWLARHLPIRLSAVCRVGSRRRRGGFVCIWVELLFVGGGWSVRGLRGDMLEKEMDVVFGDLW